MCNMEKEKRKMDKLAIGAILDHVSGYITLRKYVIGQTLSELEKRLGYHTGRLSKGVFIGVPTVLPNLLGFEFAGYSMVPDHKFTEKFPTVDQNNKILRKLVLEQWSIQQGHPNQLVKLFPVISHSQTMDNDGQYPPGNGVPQWKISARNPIPFKIVGYLDNTVNASLKF